MLVAGMASKTGELSRAGWRHDACRVHRLRARAEALRGDSRASLRELAAGQHIAERHGFMVLLVDLLVLDRSARRGQRRPWPRCGRWHRAEAEPSGWRSWGFERVSLLTSLRWTSIHEPMTSRDPKHGCTRSGP
ncbi:hypothetical protein WMF37_42130 [Sorangium sp. So ce291]|uniref:hypothetical protein n=1 Tax=Sorangium sp. So ce291 TaxID=3133294 RepID=UPI003F5E5CE9